MTANVSIVFIKKMIIILYISFISGIVESPLIFYFPNRENTGPNFTVCSTVTQNLYSRFYSLLHRIKKEESKLVQTSIYIESFLTYLNGSTMRKAS